MVIPHKVLISSPTFVLPSPPFSIPSLHLHSPCGPVLVVADEMRLHLKWATQGGVCSDTDGSSSILKPYPLCSKSSPSTHGLPKLLLLKVLFFIQPGFYQFPRSTDKKSKSTSDDRMQLRTVSQWNFCPQPPCLTVVCQHFDFFESIKVFFGSRPKAFKRIPSTSKSDKRHGRFCAPFVFRFCCCAFSPLVAFTKQGLLSRSWKHLSNADSSSSFSPSFCLLPVHFLFPPAGLMLCDVYAPLPPGSTPSAVPRDQGPVVALWRGWERSLEPHSIERKSLWRGGVAPGQSRALWFFSHAKMGWKSWEVLGLCQCSWGTGRFEDVQVALMSHPASYVTQITKAGDSYPVRQSRRDESQLLSTVSSGKDFCEGIIVLLSNVNLWGHVYTRSGFYTFLYFC